MRAIFLPPLIKSIDKIAVSVNFLREPNSTCIIGCRLKLCNIPDWSEISCYEDNPTAGH